MTGPRDPNAACADAAGPGPNPTARSDPAVAKAAHDLDHVAGGDVDLGRAHLAVVEAQAREEGMVELEQRGAAELHALVGRKAIQQHAARDLDPDWLVGAVIDRKSNATS